MMMNSLCWRATASLTSSLMMSSVCFLSLLFFLLRYFFSNPLPFSSLPTSLPIILTSFVVAIARGEKDPVKASEKLTRQAYRWANSFECVCVCICARMFEKLKKEKLTFSIPSAGSQDNISAVVVRLLKS